MALTVALVVRAISDDNRVDRLHYSVYIRLGAELTLQFSKRPKRDFTQHLTGRMAKTSDAST